MNESPRKANSWAILVVLVMVGLLFYPPYLKRVGVHFGEGYDFSVLLFTYMSGYCLFSIAGIVAVAATLLWARPNWFHRVLLLVTLLAILGIPVLYQYRPAVVTAVSDDIMYWPTRPTLFEGVLMQGQIESNILPTRSHILFGWSADGVLHYVEVSGQDHQGWAYVPGNDASATKEDPTIGTSSFSVGSEVSRDTVLERVRVSGITKQEDEENARWLAVAGPAQVSPDGSWVAFIAQHRNGPDDVIVLKQGECLDEDCATDGEGYATDGEDYAADEEDYAADGEDYDRLTLAELEKTGADLSALHVIEFWFFFPDEDAVRQAASDIESLGLKVEIWAPGMLSSDDKSDWVCHAAKLMVPTYEDLVSIRADFEAIASLYGGEYGGWSTTAVR